MACSSTTKDGQTYLVQVEEAIHTGAYQRARLTIDSIHSLFPQDIPLRRRASELNDSLNMLEARRTIAYNECLLQVLKTRKDSLVKDFSYEKPNEYNVQGRYIHKELKYLSTTTNSFLYTYILDDGTIVVQMYYRGGKKASISDIEVSLSEEGFNRYHGENYSYDTVEGWYETLTFDTPTSQEILSFVSEHIERGITIRLRNANGVVESVPIYKHLKKALLATQQLALVLQDTHRIEQQNKKDYKRIVHSYD